MSQSDCLKRAGLVENLPILKEMVGIGNIPKNKLSTHKKIMMLSTLLNSFFEDLESAVYTKIRLNKNQKKR